MGDENKEQFTTWLSKGLPQSIKIYCARKKITIQEFVEKSIKEALKK